jgi:galactokinase
LQGTAHAEFAPDLLLRRLEHFLVESCHIIPAAAAALVAQDWPRFGVLVDRSQHAAENLLGNQVAETIFLAQSARELGAIAASAFGAGFGGSVWALIRSADAKGFTEAWSAKYQEQFPSSAATSEFFLTQAGPPAIAAQ